MSSNMNDRSYNPYGMDFLGAVEYDPDVAPDPMDAKVAAMIRLSNEEQNRRTGKNETLDKIQVTNIGGNIRMFSEPGPDPRFITFDFPDEITEEDVVAFQLYLRNSGKFSAGATLPPIEQPAPSTATTAILAEKPCDYCQQTPCFVNQVVEGSGGKSMFEFIIAGKGDELKEQGVPNHEICHALYRDATTFINGYLGKGKRKKLPVCVEGEIRDCFPSKDGVYTGFKKGFLN